MNKPLRLKAVNAVGAGWKIEAYFEKESRCAEFDLSRGYQDILGTEALWSRIPVGYSTFIQFDMSGLNEAWGKFFNEMVDLWNEKHATIQEPAK